MSLSHSCARLLLRRIFTSKVTLLLNARFAMVSQRDQSRQASRASQQGNERNEETGIVASIELSLTPCAKPCLRCLPVHLSLTCRFCGLQIEANCAGMAELISRTEIRCLHCKEVFRCQPYRPQSFYFRDADKGSGMDGHLWICQSNPSNKRSDRSGLEVEISSGKFLI